MITVLDKNVHNLAVEGTFDDCQVSVQHEGFRYELTVVTRISSRHCSAILIRIRL